MSETIGQPGAAALPRPLGIGEILRTAVPLYRRHGRTLLAIAAVVVVPSPCSSTWSATWSAARARAPATGSCRPPAGRWDRRPAGRPRRHLDVPGPDRGDHPGGGGRGGRAGPEPGAELSLRVPPAGAGPGGWSAATGGMPSAPWSWRGCSPASSTPSSPPPSAAPAGWSRGWWPRWPPWSPCPRGAGRGAALS